TLPLRVRRTPDGARVGKLDGRRILVVDDNATSREIICTYLGTCGAVVEAVETGEAGLEELEASIKSDTPFALAIVDHLMDGMDGLEFARRGTALPGVNELRLIMLSSIAWIGDIIEVSEAGIRRLVHKPIRRRELVSGVLECLSDAPANAPDLS